MNKLYCWISGCLVLLGCLTQSVSAATLQFTQPIYLGEPGQLITLTLQGSGFSSPVDGGELSLTWNPGVLEYAGASELSPWTDLYADESQVSSGSLNNLSVLLGVMDPAVGPDFQIADVMFNVIGAIGDTTLVDIINPIWSGATGSQTETVETLASEAQVVPLPSALLLLAFPLAGLGLASRRRG